MLRPAFFLVLAFAVSGAQAQQTGVPASVLSPASPGSAHTVPSSVTSPAPRTMANGRIVINPRHFRVVFGTPRARRARRGFVPVPIFVPAYPLTAEYVESDQAPDQSAAADPREDSSPDSEALRDAYNRGARDALAQQRDARYGEHYLDAREQNQSKPSPGKGKETAEPSAAATATESDSAEAQEQPDNSPATVFIFKDGHKIETRNYAIVGQTLFDFSDNGMRKIQLTDLDLNATKKANDDLGITVKLPPSTP